MKQPEKGVIVKLQASKSRNYVRYIVTMPKQYIQNLNWNKGDHLRAIIVEYKIGDKVYKGVFYYKITE